MTPEHWQQVKAVLQAALALPQDARSDYLDRACAGNEALRREAEAFLEYEPEASAALDVTGWHGAGAIPDGDPERAGPYRILRRIGEGGMGVVYLAERDDGEYRQQVAVKVLKAGPLANDLVRRFRAERQILAELDHPGIARLIDSGTTAGQLYYVMEYVDGVPVTSFCDDRRLALRQRIRLFSEICAAVSYAHHRLIVHSDLKPANILVSAEGRPKLLDFGLARVFRETAEARETATVSLMMTPAYASPEQVTGKRLNIASDVYSLGVLLYEILAGCGPYENRGASPLEVCRAVCEDEPRPPSAAARERPQAGSTPPPVAPRDLRGDLDNIVLKAMRKEPEHRYGSVREFVEDLDRYLGGFPVAASRGNAVYRCRKFVRRRRWALAACVAALSFASVAGSAVWWEGRQAELRFQEVRALAHSVIFEFHDSIQDLPGSTAARRLLVERALEYLRRLEAVGGRRRDVELELAAAYEKIGAVQSSNIIGSLGDTAGAAGSLENARRLLRAALKSDAASAALNRQLRDVSLGLSAVYEQRGDERARAAAAAEAEMLSWRLARLAPGDRRAEADAIRVTANNLGTLGNWAQALPRWREATAAYAAVLAKAPGDAETLAKLASAYDGMAGACKELQDAACALEAYRKAVQFESERMARSPLDTRAAMLLSFYLIDLAWVEHRSGRQSQAVADAEHALALQQRIADADPQNVTARLETAKTLVTTGLIHRDGRALANAIDCFRVAARIFQSTLQRDPGNQSTLLHLAWASSEAGDTYVRRARRTGAEARADWQHAAAWYQRSYETLGRVNLNGKILGILDDHNLRASVPIRLAECRLHLSRSR